MDIKSIMGRQVEMLDNLEVLLKKELSGDAIENMVKNFGAEWKTDLQAYVDNMRRMCIISIALDKAIKGSAPVAEKEEADKPKHKKAKKPEPKPEPEPEPEEDLDFLD